MQPVEFDPTVNLFVRYFDQAAETLPKLIKEYDENSVIETIRHYASHWDHCWFNAYDNTRPVGFIAGYASECPWNKSIIDANIAFVYLIDSHRNLENFNTLLKKFEEWSRVINAQNITGGDIGINPERMEKLYTHHGFKPLLMMSKELTNE